MALLVGGNHRIDLSQTLVVPRSIRPNLHRAIRNERIVRPNCCALQKTAFISDSFGGSQYAGAIYMFDYESGASLGQLAAPPEGFSEVQGGCADNDGNVYFTNTAMSTIDEYDHDGAYVATLADPGEYPVGCSHNHTTGDIAVSNILNTSGDAGSLVIYSGRSLKNTYAVPNMFNVYFLGYQENTGVLWLDGKDASGVFQYDSFSAGIFKNVTLHGATIEIPGTVAWSDKTHDMNVGDQGTIGSPTLYHVDGKGNVKGSTVTVCPFSFPCDIVQATIKGSDLVGPDAGLPAANRFAYPGGGYPNLNYPASYVQPIGSAVSPNKT